MQPPASSQSRRAPRRPAVASRPPDAAALWRDVEDHLTPTFSLWPSDRVVILYLLRRSRLAGRCDILMPARSLARATLLSRSTVRIALRRLAARGIIRILRRDYSGLRIAVKLPSELPGCISASRLPDGRSLDSLDFWTSRNRRALIFRRDGNRCFYCLRKLCPESRVLDHVIPRSTAGSSRLRTAAASPRPRSKKLVIPSAALHRKVHGETRDLHFPSSKGSRRRSAHPPAKKTVIPSPDASVGTRRASPSKKTVIPSPPRRTRDLHFLRANGHTSRPPARLAHLFVDGYLNFNSHRNLVACCPSCNMLKRDRPASALLRLLYRSGLLSPSELSSRFHALKLLADANLHPPPPPSRYQVAAWALPL